MVVMCLYTIEIPLSYYPTPFRFSIGWYAVRVVGFLSSTLVLTVLLYEIQAIYTKLLDAVLAQRREREARLMTGDAVAATIAHEVRQPLTAMIASAEAGLRFLDRSMPRLDKAKEIFTRIVAMLRGDVQQMIAWSKDAVDIAKTLHAQNPALYDHFGAMRSHMLSLVRADGALELYDGVIRARDADGVMLFDGASDQGYLDLIEEEVKPWTYMKFPFLKSLGREHGWYRVGPLARVQNCDFIPSPLAESERREFIDWGQRQPQHGSLTYHWARMIELLHCMEVIAELLDDPDILEGELMARGERRRSGVGVIEAPRGTLIHHYEVGDDDLVTMCNLIVSTTHNNQAMNEAVRSVAREYLDGHELTEGLLNHIEVAIRAYDPCLSCATHALGKMPLEVSLVGADGELLDRVQKSSEGGFVHRLETGP